MVRTGCGILVYYFLFLLQPSFLFHFSSAHRLHLHLHSPIIFLLPSSPLLHLLQLTISFALSISITDLTIIDPVCFFPFWFAHRLHLHLHSPILFLLPSYPLLHLLQLTISFALSISITDLTITDPVCFFPFWFALSSVLPASVWF